VDEDSIIYEPVGCARQESRLLEPMPEETRDGEIAICAEAAPGLGKSEESKLKVQMRGPGDDAVQKQVEESSTKPLVGETRSTIQDSQKVLAAQSELSVEHTKSKLEVEAHKENSMADSCHNPDDLDDLEFDVASGRNCRQAHGIVPQQVFAVEILDGNTGPTHLAARSLVRKEKKKLRSKNRKKSKRQREAAMKHIPDPIGLPLEQLPLHANCDEVDGDEERISVANIPDSYF